MHVTTRGPPFCNLSFLSWERLFYMEQLGQESAKGKTGAPSQGGDNPVSYTRAKRKVALFAVLFMAYVLTFLVGYRYAINTEANMWYLFQVAKCTSAVLDFAGESSAVEPFIQGFQAKAKRPQLNRWRGYADSESRDNPGDDSEYLSAKEVWYYKAYAEIDKGGSIRDFGPFVQFTAKEGLNSKSQRLRRDMAELKRDNSRQPNEKADEERELNERLDSLSAQIAALPKTKKGMRARRNYNFNFIVVPDCGAIPSLSIFAAAVLAFPAPWWKRLMGLALGLPALFGVNLGRLSTLAYVGAYDPTSSRLWFTFAHEYVWQGVFIIFVVALWMAWIELIVRRGQSI